MTTTLKQLQARATELNIKGRSKMTKAELIAAIDAVSVPVKSDVLTDEDYRLTFATMPKGEARKLRKELHRRGLRRVAALRA